MQASVVDLRYKTKDILACLRRKQKIRLTCRGKLEGVIVPAGQSTGTLLPVKSHPAVGMWKDQKTPVAEVIAELRKPRHHAH